MKKLRLLFAAIAVLLGVSANAQSWTPPTVQGEAPTDGETYKVYNVEAGKFLTEGKVWFGWNTTATLADKGSEFTYSGDASSFKLVTHRSGNQNVFTSGNGIEGDAMHLDGANPTMYGHTLMPSGYYRIHDAGGNSSSLCWGYGIPSGQNVAGVVAHADANTDGWMCDWIFVGQAANDLYTARLNLYNTLLKAYNEGASTDAASAVYGNPSATIDDLNAACEALNKVRFDNLMATADKDHPADITDFTLVNPDFEIPTANGQMPPGWTITIGGANCGQQNRTDTNPETGLSITNFIEAWHWSSLTPGLIAQTVTSLPEGTYILECDASVCHDPEAGDGTDITGAYLFIKSSLKTEREAVGNLRLRIKHYSVSFSHGGEGDVQFGLEATQDINANWLSADNFKLFYAGGVDLSVYVQALAEAVADAGQVGDLPTAAKNELDAVVSQNNKQYSSSKGYADAIAAIQEAITKAKEIAAQYASYKSTKEIVAGIKAQNVWTDKDNAASAFDNAISTADAAVDGATTVEAISAQSDAILAAAKTFIKSVDVVADKYFDLTVFIVNPHFTEGNANDPTGWTVNYPAAPEGQWGGASELRTLTHNFEAYHKQFNLSQTIADLPKGTYKVTLQGFARHDGADKDKTNLFCGIVNQAFKDLNDEYSTTSLIDGKPEMGDSNGESVSDGKYRPNGMSGSYYYFQETNPMTNQPFYTNEVQTLIAEDGDLTIGFKCETWSDWVIWDNFHLYYYGKAIQVTIDEDQPISTTEDVENANITLKRSFDANKWNTIALPFDLTDAETKAAFGNDVKVATFADQQFGNMGAISIISFESAASAAITANTPVMLKTTTANTEFKFDGKTIKAGEAKAEGTNFDFVGAYAASTTVPMGDYYIEGDQLMQSDGTATIKGTRAYLKAKSEDAKIIKATIDGQSITIVTTGINGQFVNNANNGKLYNLNGQEVKKAQKGLYIQNGKKVIVK